MEQRWQSVIGQPTCDWINVPKKDRRRKALWRCLSCGHMEQSKKQPECAAKAALELQSQ